MEADNLNQPGASTAPGSVDVPAHSGRENWRERLLNGLLAVFSIVSVPILANEVLYREDWLPPVLAWSLLPVLIVMRRGLRFEVRAAVLVAMLLVLGGWAAFTAGLMGSGRIFMGASVIVGSLLLGRRAGIGLFVIGAVATIAIGYSAVTGILVFPAPFDAAPNTLALWASHTGTFMIAVGVLLMSVLYVIERLERVHDDLRHEIAEREAVERAERETARHMKFLGAFASDTLWTTDLDLKYTYVSDSITRLRGYTPDEAREMGVAGSLALESPEVLRAMFEDELVHDAERDPGRSTRLEARLTTRDGVGLDAEINVSFLRDDSGQPIGLIGVTRDVSERKRLESAMDSVIRGTRPTGQADFFDGLTENLATVLDVHAVLIGVIQDDDAVSCVSVYQGGQHVPNFSYSLEGTPCAKVVGQSLCSFPSNVQRLFPNDQMLIDMGIESYVGIPLVDGSEKIVGVIACLDDEPLVDVRLAEGLLTIFGAHASLELSRQRAESEREAIRLQLQQAQKLESVGQLTGGIAHDFNNLLVVIQGFAELATERAAGDALLQGFLENIRAGTDRAAALTRQLLSFSRRQVMDTRPLDFNVLLLKVSAMLERLLPENIEYELSAGSGLGTIEADAGQLEQAVINLALNARDAMSEGDRLRVVTEDVQVDQQYVDAHPWATVGRFVLLRVVDTGEGMSPAILEQVFEPFFTTKPDGMGTGLGLSVVFGIVKQHGGFIDIESEVGRGTEVRVYLPVLENTALGLPQTRPTDPAAPIERGSETILVVEDEPGVRQLATTFLTRAGYRVIEAEDGDAAISQFEANSEEISLALLDVVLPKANGRIVMEQIRKIAPSVKVLFTSGYSADGIHTNFILEEDLTLLQKPYGSEALLKKVRELLDA